MKKPFILLASLFLLIPLMTGAAGADINNSGTVDIQDLGILLSSWSATGTNAADINGSGRVDIQDLGILLSAWGTSGASPTPTPTRTMTTTPTPYPPAPAVLLSEDFESGTLGERVFTYTPSGSTFHWKTSGNVTFSNEVSRSGGQSLRFNVKAGDQYNNEAPFSLGRQVSPRIWFEYYLYYPDGTEGIPGVARYVHGDDPTGGDNDKFIRLWADIYGHSLGLHTEPIGPPDEDARIHMAWDPNDRVAGYYHPDGYNAFQKPFIVGNSDRGRWVQVRIEFRTDTLGTAADGMFEGNGGLRLWKDGVLINEMVAANFDERAKPYFENGYFFGAANSGSPVDTAIYMDDLRIYTADPGW